MAKIYRFKLSDEIIEIISAFGKVYEDLPNKEFKEQWKELYESREELFNKEADRLKQLGYKKDVHEKIYKSCRYYYRKKQPKETKKRRQYTSCSEQLLNTIDEFIKLNLRSNQDIKPSDVFEQFNLVYKNLIEDEMTRLSSVLNKEDSINKIKKTFKNRCYILIKNKDNI